MLNMQHFAFDHPPEVNEAIVPAMEMFNYNRFRLSYHAWKYAFLDNLIFPINTLQLPWDSTYHVIDNFELGVQKDFPKVLTDPLIVNEAYNKWILHVTEFDFNGPLKLDEKYTFVSGGLRSTLNAFRSEYKNMFRYINKLEDIQKRKESLTVINYNPLFRVYTYGMLRFYKKVSLIMTTVMNTVAKVLDRYPDKHQYISIPWDNQIFTRDQFVRTKLKLDNTTIKFPNSFHYIFMTHLLNFIDINTQLNWFDSYPKKYWKETNFILNNGKICSIFNMQDLVDLNDKNRAYLKVVNHCNTLSILGSSGKISAIDETVDMGPENGLPVIADTKPIVPLPDMTVTPIDTTNVLNTDVTDSNTDPAKSSDTTVSIDTSPISVITDTKAIIAKNIVPLIKPNIASSIRGVTNTVSTTVVATPAPAIVKDPLIPELAANVTKVTPITDSRIVKEQSKAFITTLDKDAKDYIAKQDHLTPKQKERLLTLSTKYKQVSLEDETLSDILLNNNDVMIDDVPVPGIVDSLPDKSMAKSSVFNFDKAYVNKTLKKDLVSIAVEFNRNGMFLTDVKTATILNELTHATEYTFNYEDVNGKKHTIKFSVPIIDSDGYCYVNGVKKLLKKQMVNIPICKIGENKVSMVSNYNKVLVFRNTAKAHSFIAQMDKVFELGKQQLDIVFGTLELNLPVAYEYSVLATKYNAITLRKDKGTELWDSDRVVLCFDYYNRYQHLVDDAVKTKVDALEKRFGLLVGKQSNGAYYFIDTNNQLTLATLKGDVVTPAAIYSILDIFKLYYPADISAKIGFITEWVDLNLVSKPLPVGFVLGYQFGLKNTLDHLGVKYKLLAKRGKSVVEESVVGTESLSVDKVKDPGNGVFFIHKNDRPANLPPLINIKEYWHTGVVYEGKVYECFNGGKWDISDIQHRLSELKLQHAVFIGEINSSKVRINEKKLHSEIKSGTSCSTYVARVLGLDHSTGDKKTMYPDDVFALIWSKTARLPMLSIGTESNKVVTITDKKKWKTQEVNYLELLDKYDIPKDKIVIGGSAAMIAHRYVAMNNDIDAIVDTTLLSMLKAKHKFKLGKVKDCSNVLISPCGKLEVSNYDGVLGKEYDFKKMKSKCSDIIDGYYFVNLDTLFKFYTKLNRPKDQDKIAWLTKELTAGMEVLTDKYTYTPGDIVIKFKDCNLVFNRYPLAKSLIVAGLDYFNTQMFNFDEFDTKDVYFSLMQDRGITPNYLKAVKSFFDLFVDPITRDILEQMNEPTNVRDLLIRATVLLTTDDHLESSAIANHRLRSYEQFNAIVYNEMARAMASFQTGRGKGNVFSVNPNAIFQRIVQNQSFTIVEDANPLQELKDKSNFTFSGIGGRTSESFVVDDRRYPIDGMGVVSESTVDNQKVSMNSSLTTDPSIANTRGLIEKKTLNELAPTNLLSVPALTMPCATNDDGVI